jgi:hypothetical protein
MPEVQEVMRILVTGSRNLVYQRGDYSGMVLVGGAIEQYLREHGWMDDEVGMTFGYHTIVHGSCPTGADFIAREWAILNFLPDEPHPADWSIGKKAGPLRNQEMVDLGADVVLAFPVGASRGTRDCIRRAETAGLEVRVFEGGAIGQEEIPLPRTGM